MVHRCLLCMSLALMILGSACGPARLEPADPQPLPSPTGSWTLSLTQSGGIAGVSKKVEISSDGELTAQDLRTGRSVTQTLSQETMARLTDLYIPLMFVTPQSPPSACADCFIYDLSVSAGGRVVNVHADDTTVAASGATELIALLRQLRDEALRSQP